MIRALIIDDEKDARFLLRDLIERKFKDQVKILDEADDVDTGIEIINKHNPDLIFLDVKMPKGTGFDLLSQLTNVNFEVIFLSAYDTYAIKAFEFAALHYLLKPIKPSDFIEAVGRFEKKELPHEQEFSKKTRRFHVKTVDMSYNFVYNELAYIEADGSYSIIHTTSGDEIFTSKKLADYKELLGHEFYRVHNSFIINLNCIRMIDERNNLVVLNNDAKIPISRRRKTAFKHAFEIL